MFRKLAAGAIFLLLVTVAALAADLNGKWTATVTTPRGEQNITFNLKTEGAKLTGTVETPRGSMDIQDGKVDGDQISFTQVMSFNGNERHISYKGKVDGDKINFTRTFEDRPPVEFTATREGAAK